jgi:probable phosphoglycerate mutase
VEHVGERADGVIARALAAAGGSGQVALFAHAHILRILAARWIGLPAVGGRLFGLGTGSVSVLGFERETRVVSKWNRGFEEGSE